MRSRSRGREGGHGRGCTASRMHDGVEPTGAERQRGLIRRRQRGDCMDQRNISHQLVKILRSWFYHMHASDARSGGGGEDVHLLASCLARPSVGYELPVCWHDMAHRTAKIQMCCSPPYVLAGSSQCGRGVARSRCSRRSSRGYLLSAGPWLPVVS